MRDELAEFDVTEAEFDAMLAEGLPVEVTRPPEVSGRVRFRAGPGRAAYVLVATGRG